MSSWVCCDYCDCHPGVGGKVNPKPFIWTSIIHSVPKVIPGGGGTALRRFFFYRWSVQMPPTPMWPTTNKPGRNPGGCPCESHQPACFCSTFSFLLLRWFQICISKSLGLYTRKTTLFGLVWKQNFGISTEFWRGRWYLWNIQKQKVFISKKRRRRFAEGSSPGPHSLIPIELNLACVLLYVFGQIIVTSHDLGL